MANEFVARKGIISVGIISGSGNLSIIGNGVIGGDLTVGGTITAQEFRAELVSSSIIYESGSTIFGDSLDDTHFRTGSYYISSSVFNVTSSNFDLLGAFNQNGTSTITGQLNVDNIRIDENTISSQNTDGDIILAPNGIGLTKIQSSIVEIGSGGTVNGTVASANGSGGDLILGVEQADNSDGPIIRLRNFSNPISSPISGGISITTTNSGTTGSVIISSSGFEVFNIKDGFIGSLAIKHDTDGRSNFLVNTNYFKTTNSGSTLTLGFEGNSSHISGSIRLSTLGVAGDLYYASIIPPYGASLPGNVTHELPYSSGRLALTSEIGVTTYTNSTDNRVITSTGGTGINGEANLTFDGVSVLRIGTGSLETPTGSVIFPIFDAVNGVNRTIELAVLGNDTDQSVTQVLLDIGGYNLPTLTIPFKEFLPVQSYTNSTDNRIITSTGGAGINGEANLTFNGSTLTVTGALTTTGNATLGNETSDAHTVTGSLGISGSFNILQSSYGAQVSSSVASGANIAVASIATGSLSGVFFDYTISLSTTGRRVGTVMTTWLPGSATVQFTDYSTLDIGLTNGVSMGADISAGRIRLTVDNQSGNPIDVKTMTRAI